MKKFFTKIRTGSALAAIALAPALFAQETLPYEITFSSSNYSTWTILDLNQDGDNFGAKKWSWWSNNSMLRFNLTSSQNGAANDWVISPAFNLEAGTQYEISYYFYGYTSSAKNIPVDLKLVTSNTAPESSGTILASYPDADGGTTTKTGDSKTVVFTATASGTYYIGAHLTAEYSGYPNEKSGSIAFRNFGIKALQKATAPGALGALSVTPGANGAETATISFTAPTLDAEGNPLTGKVKVNLYREDETTPFFTSEEITAGEAGTATDNSPFAGETWYVARAENGSGEGPEMRADAWIGEDVPVAVTNILVKANADGKLAVTWNAPAESVHGGYINYAGLQYQITRVLNEQLSSLGTVNTTSFTDADLSADAQANVSYQVIAKSGAGLGASAQSATVNYGKQLALPFAESFANKAYTTAPWRQEVVFNFPDAGYQPGWELIEQATVTDNVTDDNPEGDEIIIASQDTDRGFIKFNSSAVGKMKEAAKGRLVSPAIDFSAMQNPVLTFWMFRETYYTTNPATNGGNRDDFVEIEAASDNGAFTKVEGAEFHRYGTQNNWVLCEVPLYSMAGKSRVQIGFTGNGFGGGPIYIDNIRIEEKTAFDLQAVALAGPKRVRVGETGVFTASVKNGGGKAVDSYTVELLKDGQTVMTLPGKEVLPGRVASFVFNYVPEMEAEGSQAEFTAKVVYAADQDQTNNVSEAVTAAITAPLLPAVTGLEAENIDGTVTLKWGKADYLPAETLVEEDGFEAYEPFVINSFGEFTTYDLDGNITFGIGQSAGVDYPNSGEKIAFQIFAPTLTNIDEEELHLWAPHSGVNMAIAPQAYSAAATSTGGAVPSNDWLVFPRLSGNAQTIKFFARSLKDDYREYIQGFYTTTASPTDADDFIPCPDGGDTSYAVPTEWTELSYSVPKNAKYFALRHVSADGYALMVDDVTYERSIPDAAEAGLTGYNVYCNGEKVNDDVVPAATRTLDHKPATNGEKEYTVAAVYPAGESARSNAVKVIVDQNDIEGIAAETYTVVTDGLRVTVNGAAGVNVSLYSTAGNLIDTALSAGSCTLEASAPGIYMLTIGNKVVKMVLR